jgi:PPPDE putative peptidase domain
MAEVGDVTLNIYKLSVPAAEGSSSNFWTSRLLPAIGIGAYHTSITVGTKQHYTFAARHGIVESRKEPTDSSAVFQESLFLGYCRLHRGQVLEIVQNMKATFSETAYHLVHRNCNHFTETFATALLRYDDIMAGKQLVGRLDVFPVYINRLAATGSVFVGHDDDIVVRVRRSYLS